MIICNEDSLVWLSDLNMQTFPHVTNFGVAISLKCVSFPTCDQPQCGPDSCSLPSLSAMTLVFSAFWNVEKITAMGLGSFPSSPSTHPSRINQKTSEQRGGPRAVRVTCLGYLSRVDPSPPACRPFPVHRPHHS